MSFIAVVAIGLVVGLVARFLMPGKDGAGFNVPPDFARRS